MTLTIDDLRAELATAIRLRSELPWRDVRPTPWTRVTACKATATAGGYQLAAWRVLASPSWDWAIYRQGDVVDASDTTRTYTAVGALYAASQALRLRHQTSAERRAAAVGAERS